MIDYLGYPVLQNLNSNLLFKNHPDFVWVNARCQFLERIFRNLKPQRNEQEIYN